MKTTLRKWKNRLLNISKGLSHKILVYNSQNKRDTWVRKVDPC